MKAIVALVFLLLAARPATAQEVIYRCEKPPFPLRFAKPQDPRPGPPTCHDWVQMRGKRLGALLAAFAGERHSAANEFLAEASKILDVDYPVATGGPATTMAVYADPEGFGFETIDPAAAPTGSPVVYNGLAGILVEVRRSEHEPWTKQIIYPSAKNDFQLVVADLRIPGKAEAKVLAEKSVIRE